MTLYVDTDTFGPTGNMKRREAVYLHPLWPSHRVGIDGLPSGGGRIQIIS